MHLRKITLRIPCTPKFELSIPQHHHPSWTRKEEYCNNDKDDENDNADEDNDDCFKPKPN